MHYAIVLSSIEFIFELWQWKPIVWYNKSQIEYKASIEVRYVNISLFVNYSTAHLNMFTWVALAAIDVIRIDCIVFYQSGNLTKSMVIGINIL